MLSLKFSLCHGKKYGEQIKLLIITTFILKTQFKFLTYYHFASKKIVKLKNN